MPDARYFLPDHPSLREVYSKDDLRGLLQAGRLSRSDMVLDDETGLAHLLGDLLAAPYREPAPGGERLVPDRVEAEPPNREFRADTPLPEPAGGRWDYEDYDEDERVANVEGAGDADEAPEAVEAGAGGEELLYHGHPSWLAYPRSILVLLVLGVAAWFSHRLHAGMVWVMVLGSIGVLPALFAALDRTTTSFYVTTRRVELEFGIIGRSTKEVRISDIRAIDVVQRGYGAVVGIGDVRFDSSAGPNAEVEFRHVRRPHDVKQLVRELQG